VDLDTGRGLVHGIEVKAGRILGQQFPALLAAKSQAKGLVPGGVLASKPSLKPAGILTPQSLAKNFGVSTGMMPHDRKG